MAALYDEQGNVISGTVDGVEGFNSGVAAVLAKLPASYTEALKTSKKEPNTPKLASTKKNGFSIVETTPPTNIYQTKVDEPSQTSLESMGDIKNSSIAVSNVDKVHVCDTTLFIRQKINLGKIAKTVIIAIRDAIKEIMLFLGITPGSNALVEDLKALSRYIRDKIKILKEINTAIDTFILLVREIKAVIEYILNLPARLIAYFLGCLKEAYAELAKQFADVVSQVSGAVDDATGGIIDATKDVIKATGELITNAAATAAKAATAVPTGLTSNSTAAEKAKAEQFVTSAYSDYKPVTDFKTA